MYDVATLISKTTAFNEAQPEHREGTAQNPLELKFLPYASSEDTKVLVDFIALKCGPFLDRVKDTDNFFYRGMFSTTTVKFAHFTGTHANTGTKGVSVPLYTYKDVDAIPIAPNEKDHAFIMKGTRNRRTRDLHQHLSFACDSLKETLGFNPRMDGVFVGNNSTSSNFGLPFLMIPIGEYKVAVNPKIGEMIDVDGPRQAIHFMPEEVLDECIDLIISKLDAYIESAKSILGVYPKLELEKILAQFREVECASINDAVLSTGCGRPHWDIAKAKDMLEARIIHNNVMVLLTDIKKLPWTTEKETFDISKKRKVVEDFFGITRMIASAIQLNTVIPNYIEYLSGDPLAKIDNYASPYFSPLEYLSNWGNFFQIVNTKYEELSIFQDFLELFCFKSLNVIAHYEDITDKPEEIAHYLSRSLHELSIFCDEYIVIPEAAITNHGPYDYRFKTTKCIRHFLELAMYQRSLLEAKCEISEEEAFSLFQGLTK